MHIILGGTGHVGSAVAEALLERGEPVLLIARDPAKAERLRREGAEVAIADVRDTARLREVFRRGRRLFLLNPPAAPSTDTDREERGTLSSILAALEGSGLERVVAESTYGARPAERTGDLGILHTLERALEAGPIPASIIRAAYYMTNWDASLEAARRDGVVHTVFPASLALPMVAPADLGRVAARLMTEPAGPTGRHHVEGPERYSPSDVAAAFAMALGRPVRAVAAPREAWVETFRGLGFSEAAAESYARMTAATVDGVFPPVEEVERGQVSLRDHVSALVRARG